MGGFDQFLASVLDEVQKEKAAQRGPKTPPRIRWWEMPSRMDKVATPFAVIIDRWPEGAQETIWAQEWGARVQAQTGSAGVLIFPFEIEIGESR